MPHVLLLIYILLAASVVRAESPRFDREAQVFFKTHCLRCHDAKKQKGDFRLDNLSHDFANSLAAEKWAEVMTRINTGEMPPQKDKNPKPTSGEVGKVVEWINAEIDAGRAARMAKRGSVAHYRLSRDEYAATVYDLLGVHYDVHAPGAFDEDPRWHGFERIGSQLSLSPSHVSRYLKAAETVLERAFAKNQPESTVDRHDAIELRHRHYRKQLEALGIADKVRIVMFPRFREAKFGVRHAGRYRVRIQLSGLQPKDGSPPHLSLWHEQLKRSIYDRDILAPEDKPEIVEVELSLSPGDQVRLVNEVPKEFNEVGNHTFNVINSTHSIFLGTKDSRFINPTGYKFIDDEGEALFPLLLLDWVEVEGPILTDEDLKKREGLYPAKEDLAEARASLKRFAGRAWRRPATDLEIDRYVKIVESEMTAGEKFHTAYMAAMSGVLVSKNFYYITEGSVAKPRDTVNEFELATRLSYLLWGSMPDPALLDEAKAGKLKTPEGLKAQMSRMIADKKISRFTDAFPKQWLQLHKVGMFPPDPKLYPDYDNWLEQSMILESSSFFGEVFAKNLSIREFLDSKWTMVNPRLAMHYKLPPLAKSGFHRVTLRPEDHRGGLLAQASMLSATSDGTRHRPVHRGVLVSEAIFAKTPPPPPPNVEPLEPTPTKSPKATIRQQLEAHTTHATCASCHAKIDPLGFAFDNYDAIGRYRKTEQATGEGDDPIVKAHGKMPDGRAFDGPAQFKKLLAENTDEFAEAFVEQLATFALRRVMTIDDRSQIKAIAEKSKKTDYKLRALLENFILSDLFRKR